MFTYFLTKAQSQLWRKDSKNGAETTGYSNIQKTNNLYFALYNCISK